MSKQNTNYGKRSAPVTNKAPEHHRVKPGEHPAVGAGSAYCTECGAVYSQKLWHTSSRELDELKQKNELAVICPGCEMVKSDLYEGELVLTNLAAKVDREEMMSVVKHAEKQCWRKNPNSRVVAVAEESDGIHIFTTTRLLAERIGKAMQSAYKGTLKINHLDDLTRLTLV